jgi:hypothetical protein
VNLRLAVKAWGLAIAKSSQFIELQQEAVADYLVERSALWLKIVFFVERAIHMIFALHRIPNW